MSPRHYISNGREAFSGDEADRGGDEGLVESVTDEEVVVVMETLAKGGDIMTEIMEEGE